VPRFAFVALRLAFVSFFFLTSLYCLLAYTPFTWTQVIQAGLLPWLGTFARLHRWLYLAAAGAGIASLWPDIIGYVPRPADEVRPARGGIFLRIAEDDRRVRELAALKGRRKEEAQIAAPWTFARVLAAAYALLLEIAGIALAIHPVLPALRNDIHSFVWSQIALLPPLIAAAIDHLAVRKKFGWGWTSTREDESVFRAASLCLAIAFVTYAAIFHLRAAGALALTTREELVALLISFLVHATFLGCAFAAWCLVRSLANGMGGPRAATDYALVALSAAGLFAVLSRNLAFPAMSFRGPFATAAAASWGLTLIAIVSGMAFRVQAETGKPVVSGLRLFFAPLSFPDATRLARILSIALILGFAIRMQIVASQMDWNGLMQKLFACLTWILLFAASLSLFQASAQPKLGTIVLLFLSCSGTVIYRSWRTFGRPADMAPALAKLATAEPSFGFLYDLAGSEGKRASMGDLFDFMQRNTSFGQERAIAPLDVRFANNIGKIPGPRPHIFIIVVDSLRRDYVSAFNPAVTFTPSLDAFAHESDVFTNAFTHYGATGLSEPSIWVGGMMPHKQYITPFAPMNGLEKLLLGEHYVRMVSVDSILAQLIDQGPSLVHLDEHTVTGNLDLCASLEELRTKIDERKSQDVHLFAYTQAQNIHVSTITREGASVPPGVHFPGFYDPYASRLQRIDACFGQFIEALKADGIYDDSLIVFTADHGDLLGEEGRWGHAYNLNPEVIRIPLIIHRPARLRGVAVDTKAIAFSTDITPSIYRLLGYTPAALGPAFGQSLYGPRVPDREWYMLVSSYGPVYGILEDEGRHVYVADAVNYNDNYYDVRAGSNAQRDSVSEETRGRDMERIRAGVKELHEAYHLEDVEGPARSEPAPSAAPK
jgi:arylsulfatase A-like enzyme